MSIVYRISALFLQVTASHALALEATANQASEVGDATSEPILASHDISNHEQ